jgi:hypothetical protein
VQWTLPAGLPEASGVAVSRRHDGVLWVHNDGRDSTLWALAPDRAEAGSELMAVARVTVAAESWDWEALDAGACPAALRAPACLWIADTGNNGLYREVVRLMVVPEPDVAGGGDASPPVATPRVLHVRYPDARRDTEALFVVGDTPFLVSKGNTGAATLYRVPLPPDWRRAPGARAPGDTAPATPGAGRPPPPGSSEARPLTLVKVQELAPDGLGLVRQFTGAAAVPAPDAAAGGATRVLLRSYTQLRLFTLSPVGLRPVEGGEVNLLSLREPQGEGVAVGPDGRVWLVSESGPTGARGALTAIRCDDVRGS